jgi:hypothetical protein
MVLISNTDKKVKNKLEDIEIFIKTFLKDIGDFDNEYSSDFKNAFMDFNERFYNRIPDIAVAYDSNVSEAKIFSLLLFFKDIYSNIVLPALVRIGFENVHKLKNFDLALVNYIEKSTKLSRYKYKTRELSLVSLTNFIRFSSKDRDIQYLKDLPTKSVKLTLDAIHSVIFLFELYEIGDQKLFNTEKNNLIGLLRENFSFIRS